MQKKLFTKSAFKVALDCPWKLYYYRNPDVYANANASNDFLEALAEGGFQVGELAKYYTGVDDDADLKDLMGYDESLARTNELMQRENVTIAEAAFKYGNMFVRVDILKKRGNHIDLIEVKAKSWNPETDSFIGKRPKDAVATGIRPYVYDAAFQKYVVSQALPEYSVTAYLIMADKSKCADIDGINQLFKIGKNAQGRTEATMISEAKATLAQSQVELLTAFDVDKICDDIIAGKTTEQLTTQKHPIMQGLGFKEFVKRASDCYCKNIIYQGKPELCGTCVKCEFHKVEDSTKKDGKRECWLQYVSPADYDNRPLLETMNGSDLSTNRDKWIRQGLYFMDQLGDVLKSYNEKKVDQPGLDGYQRKWLQIGLETKNAEVLSTYAKYLNGTTYLNTDDLRDEMKTWKFPLHMIDFETTAVALPYYKGMKPYEQVAFQFSHHMIYENGRIEHAGQYLNNNVAAFPNFEFVRELKRQLEGDDGTVFRYANHENTILCAIAEQLSNSNEPDKDELIAFIRTLTHAEDKKNPSNSYRGVRDMVDLLEVVKHYFYNLEEMHGSNSIKQVLPAVLNCSQYLKNKYSKPIYGSQIKSCNIKPDEPLAWVEFDENGHVDSPYHRLESVGSLIGATDDEIDLMERLCVGESEFTVANGGAALTAYNKLMFCDNTTLGTIHYDKLREALLRYCELDTMSMVFIWEYFNHECNRS